MALFPDYGFMKAPAKKHHNFASHVVEAMRSAFTGSVTRDDIPALLDLRSLNQKKKSGAQAFLPLLPHPVYKARLHALAIARNYGFTPGRLVTTPEIAARHGDKLTEVAINDCGILQWAMFPEKDKAWIPLRVEWFDNRVTYHEYTGLVLIGTPKEKAA